VRVKFNNLPHDEWDTFSAFCYIEGVRTGAYPGSGRRTISRGWADFDGGWCWHWQDTSAAPETHSRACSRYRGMQRQVAPRAPVSICSRLTLRVQRQGLCTRPNCPGELACGSDQQRSMQCNTPQQHAATHYSTMLHSTLRCITMHRVVQATGWWKCCFTTAPSSSPKLALLSTSVRPWRSNGREMVLRLALRACCMATLRQPVPSREDLADMGASLFAR
jgi:hypothetical protein